MFRVGQKQALTKVAAINHADEEKAWTCATCTTLIEHESTAPYCRACGEYWKDVEKWNDDEWLLSDSMKEETNA